MFILKKLQELAPYAKAVGAFLVGLGTFAGIVVVALADGHISPSEAVSILIALGGWLTSPAVVYQTTNTNVAPK